MQTINFPQFTGGKDSTPFSHKADNQKLICMYRETIQSGDNESQYVIQKTPGLQERLIQGSCHRGTLQLNNYVFDAIDAEILLIDKTFLAGNFQTYAPIANDG